MSEEVIINRQFVTTMSYSPCQQYVVMGTYNTDPKAYNIVVYTFPKFKVSSIVSNAHTAPIKHIIFSNNGKLLISCGCDGFIRFFSQQKCIWELGDYNHPQKVSLEASGVYLTSVNCNGTMVVWNIVQRKMSARFVAILGRPTTLQFLGTSDRIILVSGGGPGICDCTETQGTEERKDQEVIPIKDNRGKLTIWNWYTHQRLYHIDEPGSGPIISIFQKQWIVAAKTDSGIVEMINVWNNGDFERALVDVRMELTRNLKPQFLAMKRLKNVLISSQNEIQHCQVEAFTESQPQLNNQLVNLQNPRSISNKRITRMGTFGVTAVPTMKAETQQTRLKLTTQARLEQEQKIQSISYVQEHIVMAMSDGSIQWVNEEFNKATKYGTQARTSCVKICPNCQTIAVGDDDGYLTLISVQTKTTRNQTKAHNGPIDFVNFKNDRTLISKGKDGFIKIWDILDDEFKLALSLDHDSDTDMSISEDQQFIVVGCNTGQINVYRTTDWSLITMGASGTEITAVCFAGGSKYIISANLNKSIFVTDFEEKMIIKKFEGHQDPIICLAASPLGSQFASGGYDAMIKVWSITQRALVGTLMGHQECIKGMKYSWDGKLLFTCSEDKTIRVWSLAKMTAIVVLEAGEDQINSFDVLHQKNMIIYTQLDMVKMIQGKKQPVKFKALPQQEQIKVEEATALCWNNHEQCMAYNIADEIFFMKGEKRLSKVIKCDGLVRAIQIQHNRIYAICENEDSNQYFINIFEDGKLIKTIQDETTICSNANNSLFITSNETEVTIWDGVNISRSKILPQAWVSLLAVGEIKSLVACWEVSGAIQVWDYSKGEKIYEYQAFLKKKVISITFCKFDEYIGCTGEGGMVHVVSVYQQDKFFHLVGHTGNVYGLAFINDDKNALTCGEDGTVRFWNLDPVQMVHVLAIHKHPITSIAVYNNRIAYRFGSTIAKIDVQKDIIQNLQVISNDCAPLMHTQELQLQMPNSILSRHLGSIFRPHLKNILMHNEELIESMPYLNENTLKRSAFYQKIRSHILNPKLRDNLLDQFTLSEFLLQEFDDGLGFAIFNETFEMLRELLYSNLSRYVQNMFYTVVNNQSIAGTRILHEILSQQKFSCLLSMKELQYLLALIKFLRNHIAHLHNPIKYEVQLRKIISVSKLNLARNAYLSSILCKSLMLRSVDKTFEQYRLLTPMEMFQNQHFNLYLNEEYWPRCYNKQRAERIEQQISRFTYLRDKIADFRVDEYDNFIQDFLLELLEELECLQSIDLSYLNLSDEFCERFCNYFIDRPFAPDLSIHSNERITNVGKKYMQVLYTRHRRSRFQIQNQKQAQVVNEQLKDKIKFVQMPKFRKRFDEAYQEQIDLVVADLSMLQKSVAESMQKSDHEDNLLLNIEDYYDQQCQNIKRQQILLNFGVLGYLSEALFKTNQTVYCTFCNRYVCSSCHSKPHQSSDPCILCLKCYGYHQGMEEAYLCDRQSIFDYIKARSDLYQKYKFQQKDEICFYGTLKCLQIIEQNKDKFSAHLGFRFRLNLFVLLTYIGKQVETLQIFINYVLRKLVGRPQIVSQEDKKAVVYESLEAFEPDKYNFNQNVFDLDISLSPTILMILFIFSFLAWYVLAITLPIVFPGHQTVAWEAHFVFSGYLLYTIIFEISLISYMIHIVNKSLESEVKLLPDISRFKVINFIFVSALSKYDLYTDVIFASILYRVGNGENSSVASKDKVVMLFYASVIFILLPCMINLVQLTYFTWREIAFRMRKNKKRFKTLRLINFYSKLSYLMEDEALAWFLDKFASNTAVKIGHRYVPQKIITAFIKVTFENIPQLMIQLLYQLTLATEYNWVVAFTTVTTIFSLIMQFFNFISAKSSPINSIDLMKMQVKLGYDVLQRGNVRRYSTVASEQEAIRTKEFSISDLNKQDLPTDEGKEKGDIELTSRQNSLVETQTYQPYQDEL